MSTMIAILVCKHGTVCYWGMEMSLVLQVLHWANVEQLVLLEENLIILLILRRISLEKLDWNVKLLVELDENT